MERNDNNRNLFGLLFVIHTIYFTSAYVLITLVIKTNKCPRDLVSAKLCRYHKATKYHVCMRQLIQKGYQTRQGKFIIYCHCNIRKQSKGHLF